MSTVLIHLSHKIDEACRVIEEDLAAGHVKDLGDYKFACGRYRGMLTVKDMIIELAHQMEHDDD